MKICLETGHAPTTAAQLASVLAAKPVQMAIASKRQKGKYAKTKASDNDGPSFTLPLRMHHYKVHQSNLQPHKIQ